jgi:pimeloyl-ACP methyl ester carboxylesterase
MTGDDLPDPEGEDTMNQGVSDQPTARRKHRWLARLGILIFVIIAVLAALPFLTPAVETLVMDDAARAGTCGKYIALSDGIVHYEASGLEGAPAVVFVHGSSNPYHVWDSNFPIVADAGYRVVRYDRYGVGYSDRLRGIRYDADLFDRQLLELIGKLKVKTPLTLVGFSLGGNIAVIFAERHPELVNGLILISPGGFPLPKTSRGFFNLLRLPGVGEYFIRLLGGKMSDPAGQVSDLYDQALLPGYVERLKGLERYKGTLSASLSTIRHFPIQGLESSYRAAADSGKPVLCIWGKEDRVVPFATAEKVMAAMPRVELLAIEQAGHASHYEKRDVVNAAILSFLRRIAPVS